MKTFAEFRTEISIIDLAKSIGYKLDNSKGQKWPVLVNQYNDDTIIIVNPNSSSNQGYFNPANDQDKGTLINFIKNRLGTEFKNDTSISEPANINKVLYKYLNLEIPAVNNDNVIKPPYKIYQHQDFNTNGLTSLINNEYLLFRNLNAELLISELFINKILSIQNNGFTNIAFPFTNKEEKILAIQKKNANYDGFTPGSQKESTVWHSNMPQKLEKIIVTESVIDALSYHQLKPSKDVLYVATGGSIAMGQIEVIRSLRSFGNTSSNFIYVSAVDNDIAGKKYDIKLKELLHPDTVVIDKPISKDFNQDLANISNIEKKKGIKIYNR